MRTIRNAFLLLTFMLVAWTASSYVLQSSKWPSGTTTMNVSIGSFSSSFETAMAMWNDVTQFRFGINRTYGDPCANPNITRQNGVAFSASACGEPWGQSTLAIERGWFNGTTKIQSGIVFNSNHQWGVYNGPWDPSTAGVKDFQRVAVHELGHTIGLGHEDDVPAIMNTFVSPGSTVTRPQPDDIAGVGALYGTGPQDLTGPSVQVTSHQPGQGVSDPIVMLSGTASDLGRGSNGISSVTVNGVRALNDTAQTSETANWMITVPLQPGLNMFEIAAYDNSPSRNVTRTSFGLYFGTPSANTAPFGYIDRPFRDAVVSGVIDVAGWVLDRENPNLTLALLVDGIPISLTPRRENRPDVCSAFSDIPHCGSSLPGYVFAWDSRSVGNGAHGITVIASDPLGAIHVMDTLVYVYNVPVQSGFGNVEYPGPGQTVGGTVPIYGWFLSNNGPLAYIELLVDGIVVSRTPDRHDRPDVCAYYSSVSHCSISKPGFAFAWDSRSFLNSAHTITVKAWDLNGTVAAAIEFAVNVYNEPPPPPFGYLEKPQQDSTVAGPVEISGWVLPSRHENVSVILMVDGNFVSDTPERFIRADVCAAFPTVTHCALVNPGYRFFWNSAGVGNGSHVIEIRAIDASGQMAFFRSWVLVQN